MNTIINPQTPHSNPLPSLIKGNTTYKIIIPTNVEKKIRFICSQIQNIEWSGSLFYTYKGSFEDGSLIIMCEDIHIMDIGTSGYTEYNEDASIIGYQIENDLLHCNIGLIHSHHTMATFFSGTDTNTLRKQGTDMNHFVSLIVNNAGNYNAAITKKIKSVQHIKESISYNSFDDVPMKSEETEKTINCVNIIYYTLEIEKEININPFESVIEERIKELKTKKSTISVNTKNNRYFDYSYPRNSSIHNPQECNIYTERGNTLKKKEGEIPKENITENKLPIRDIDMPLPYGVFTNEKIITSILKQLITGSIILSDSSKVDLNSWASQMVRLYQNRFGQGEEGIDKFSYWASNYIEFLCWYSPIKELEGLDYDNEDTAALIAFDLIESLKKLPQNIYIQEYIKILEKHII